MSKKKMTGREVLEEALRGCCSTYCDQYPRYEGKIDLGDDYEKYMHNLIKRSKNPIQRYFNTIGRRVAGIAAAMLIAFGCSMTVKAVREPVVEFFANIYDTFLEIRFGKDDIEKAPVTIETVYTLGFIPDGYMVDRFFIGRDTTNMTWKNENGDRLVLSQGILTGSNILDTEESNYDIIEQNGRKIAYSEKHEIRSFFWNSEDYEFSLTVSSNISENEVFALIDSLKKYNQ